MAFLDLAAFPHPGVPVVPFAPVGPTEAAFQPNPATPPSGTGRFGYGTSTVLNGLGALADLPGTWIGTGFNLIARPSFGTPLPFFLELNSTRETLAFTAISAPIPNRGSVQKDIQFLGVTYFQQVSDQVTLGGLHVEPGIWLNVPATTDPANAASVVRLATIPHGDSLLAQGTSLQAVTPLLSPVSSTPISVATGQPITNATYLAQFNTTPLPPGIPAGSTANPVLVLQKAIQGQDIVKTLVLLIDTKTNGGGIENIPFVTTNANATEMSAIFWIETVLDPHLGSFLQLQYVQTVTLRFAGIDWPHISVATLRKN